MHSFPKLSVIQLSGKYAIARLSPDATLPPWLPKDSFFSVSKSDEEISILCLEEKIPQTIKKENDWTGFKIKGPLPFHLTGVLSTLINPLAEANIPVFVISTFDTDYIFIKAKWIKKTKIIWQKIVEIQ